MCNVMAGSVNQEVLWVLCKWLRGLDWTSRGQKSRDKLTCWDVPLKCVSVCVLFSADWWRDAADNWAVLRRLTQTAGWSAVSSLQCPLYCSWLVWQPIPGIQWFDVCIVHSAREEVALACTHLSTVLLTVDSSWILLHVNHFLTSLELH